MTIQLYAMTALLVIVPVCALIVLFKIHKYRLTSLVCGVAAYFLSMRVLMTVVNLLFSLVGFTEAFWTAHPYVNQFLNALLVAALQNLTIYFVMKLVLKEKVLIYDAMAIGISFCFGNLFIQAYYSLYAAQLVGVFLAGNLAELASEELPLASLEASVFGIVNGGILDFYFQMFSVFVQTFLSMTLSILLYHALKKPDKRFIYLVLGIHFICLILINFTLPLDSSWWFFAANAVVLVAAILAFVKYWSWYQTQRLQLARDKKKYKESLRSS